MLYKTMVLELLQQRPQVQERLRQKRMLLPAMEFYSRELKELHQAWKEHLAATRPKSSPEQTASEALEMALSDLQPSLPSAPAQPDPDTPSVEELMAFLQDPTPPA